MSAHPLLLSLAVALGSALGGAARWSVSMLMLPYLGNGFPWASFAVNASGSLLIGLYAGLISKDARAGHGLRPAFVISGFCGGYTSFSVFSLESMQLSLAGNWPVALVYALASLLIWLLAVALGWRIGEGRAISREQQRR